LSNHHWYFLPLGGLVANQLLNTSTWIAVKNFFFLLIKNKLVNICLLLTYYIDDVYLAKSFLGMPVFG